jgi:Prophage antirepressor
MNIRLFCGGLTMDDLRIFSSEEFGEVRAVTINSEPYFVAKDIAEKLGYSETNALTKRLDEDEFISDKLEGMNMKSILINESGLYNAVLGSKLPNAKKFKKWITRDILPSIRKYGIYATEELLDNPDLLIAAATKLKEERKARLEAENKIKLLEPKAQFYDDVAGSKDSIEMGHVAKVLGIKGMGRNNIFSLLRAEKVLDRSNIPYQQYVDLGYFRVLEQKYTVPGGETKINIKTMVFQKGIDFIRKKIENS